MIILVFILIEHRVISRELLLLLRRSKNMSAAVRQRQQLALHLAQLHLGVDVAADVGVRRVDVGDDLGQLQVRQREELLLREGVHARRAGDEVLDGADVGVLALAVRDGVGVAHLVEDFVLGCRGGFAAEEAGVLDGRRFDSCCRCC